jgi:hypothetical protein
LENIFLLKGTPGLDHPGFRVPHEILANEIPIECAILDGFGEVGGLDIHLTFEIGNGSGDL